MEYIKHSWLKNVTLNVRESMHDGRQLHMEFVQLGFIHTESVLESGFPVSFASFKFPFLTTCLEFATPGATCYTVRRYLVQF